MKEIIKPKLLDIITLKYIIFGSLNYYILTNEIPVELASDEEVIELDCSYAKKK